MKMLSRLVFGIAFVILGSTGDSRAQRPFIDIRCLAHQSDNVIIGIPISVSPEAIMSDFMSDLYLAKIRVISNLRGEIESKGRPTNEFSILWRKNDSHAPRYRLGEQFLLFLKQTETGPVVLNGSEGSLRLEKGKLVIYGSLLNEQAIRIFLAKTPDCNSRKAG